MINNLLNIEIITASRRRKIIFVLTITLLFTIINLLFISQNIYVVSCFPLILIFAIILLYRLDIAFYLAIFLTPLSFQLKFEEFNLGVSLPSELILASIMLLFFFKFFIDKPINKKFIKNPLSVFILFHIIWMFLVTLTSQIHIVSAKYSIMQLWFIVPLYFFGYHIFKEKKRIYIYLFLLIIAVVLTIFYTTVHHSMYNFAEKSGNWAMRPFYNDHTMYGAILALLLPVTLGLGYVSKTSVKVKIFIYLSAFFMILGIFLSHSRATWISIAASIIFFVILRYKIKLKYILFTVIAFSVISFVSYDAFIDYLKKNRQDSSQYFVEHVQSIANITTDASNLERINRWKAAFGMIKDYPVFGSGPGTYQFLYAPYQHSKDRTIISTNVGDLGNAHSEYISPLVERGFLGLLFFLGIIISTYIVGIKAYQKTNNSEYKMLIICLLTGLFSYLTHGFLNNFLDSDKASVIFWGFICIIVTLSIKINEEETSMRINSHFANFA